MPGIEVTEADAFRRAPAAAGFASRSELEARRCRNCAQEVPSGRRTFCSPACVNAWKMRTDPRPFVFARDKGVCASCALDTVALLRRWLDLAGRWAMRRLGHGGGDMHNVRQFIHFAQPRKAIDGYCAARPGDPEWAEACALLAPIATEPDKLAHRTASLWDMDHVVPVVEGGGSCDLANLRTLCIGCHKRATADLAARRARERKAEPGSVDVGMFG